MTTPQPPQFQPVPPAFPPPRPARKRRNLWLWIGLPVAGLLLLCGGISVLGVTLNALGVPDAPAPTATPKSTHTAAPAIAATTEPTTTAPATEPPAPAELTAADVELHVKIKSQQCFGSAGCLLEYEVQAGWPEDIVKPGDTYDVTYEVSGVKDGPQTNTLTITGPTQYEHQDTESAQTTRHVKSLKAKVTEVEKQ